MAGAFTTVNAFNQRFHLPQCAMDFGNDVVAVNPNLALFTLTKGGVQGGALFREVHEAAPEQGRTTFLQTTGPGQVEQSLQHAVRQPIAGEIQRQAGTLYQITLGTARILLKQLPHG